ncbi:MAG: phosphodiester glycosidase family protein [Lachnospiraceae bacterium]|nr:phosphodiester glycosidase family protein [Lachnospiraceae bacterium]
MLDTFVISSGGSDASKMNTSMFEGMETGSSAATPSSSDSSRKKPSGSGSKPSGSHSDKKPGESGDRRGSGGPFKNEDSSKTESILGDGNYSDYSDDNIKIKISEYTENGTKIHVADVTLSSAVYLKTALANDSYGKNITAATSEIAKDKNAILAINGDYYGARESGYVIRNGVIYRDTGSNDTDVLCIYADGHFEITDSSKKTASELLSENVWQAFSFGPALLEDGELTSGSEDTKGRLTSSNPRTAIGIIDDLHYVFLVSDGRTDESEGLTIKELAEFMKKLGARTAYNLDGGGSSTMYYQGEIVNTPTTSGRDVSERKVSDIVYIGY